MICPPLPLDLLGIAPPRAVYGPPGTTLSVRPLGPSPCEGETPYTQEDLCSDVAFIARYQWAYGSCE